jgi:hypothetical protein
VAQGGSERGRWWFGPKGKKENWARATSVKKWRGGSGAGDAMRRKLEGRGTRPGGVWCWQGREVVGHLSRGPAGGRKELGRA